MYATFCSHSRTIRYEGIYFSIFYTNLNITIIIKFINSFFVNTSFFARRTPLCGPIRGRGTCRSDSATRPRNCPGKYSPDGNWPGWRYSPKSPRPPGSRQPKPRRRTGRNRPAPRLRNRPESLRRRNSSRCVPPYGYAL